MKDKELVHVANRVRRALLQLQMSRYLECARQISLFMPRMRGLTCESRKLDLAISREWLAAAEQCCKNVSRCLDEIPYATSKLGTLLDKRQRPVPTLSAVVEELRAVDEEFDDVAFNAEEEALCVVTEPITLEDVHLGRFRILLDLDRLGGLYQRDAYYIIAIDPHPATNDEAVTHPHVSNEVLCEGDGHAAIRAALEDGRLSDFFSMVRSILTTYNPDSPYVSLDHWEGVSCYDCGYVMGSEECGYCGHCDSAICDNCSRVCINCGQILCSECVSHCEVCDRPLCPNCAETKCSECGSVCCESCLEDGLCPECKEDKENNDEEQQAQTTNEDTDTTTNKPQTIALGG